MLGGESEGGRYLQSFGDLGFSQKAEGGITNTDTMSRLHAVRWDNEKRLLDSLRENLEESLWVDQKELEKSRGFLIYMYRTYPSLTPFLKGLHLTIDAWRPEIDAEGWRMAQSEL
jgi:hypothetical protein